MPSAISAVRRAMRSICCASSATVSRARVDRLSLRARALHVVPPSPVTPPTYKKCRATESDPCSAGTSAHGPISSRHARRPGARGPASGVGSDGARRSALHAQLAHSSSDPARRTRTRPASTMVVKPARCSRAYAPRNSPHHRLDVGRPLVLQAHHHDPRVPSGRVVANVGEPQVERDRASAPRPGRPGGPRDRWLRRGPPRAPSRPRGRARRAAPATRRGTSSSSLTLTRGAAARDSSARGPARRRRRSPPEWPPA